MSVTCHFNGRLGNVLFNMCQVIAYCKRYNLQWHFPTYAWACTNGIVPISVPDTGIAPLSPTIYNEPADSEGHPYYHDIPYVDNVEFRGYYQSFRYFDDYREEILDTIKFPYFHEDGITAVHCRRGDCVNQPDAFPMAPMEYYHKAIDYMLERGFSHFRIFSDDIPWCREEFTESNYPGCTFEFREGYSDRGDFTVLLNCQNIITARSTFSLMAGWFNPNPNKIVLCPATPPIYWHKQNRNLLDSSFLTQIHW